VKIWPQWLALLDNTRLEFGGANENIHLEFFATGSSLMNESAR
jgi:hypothetical protein